MPQKPRIWSRSRISELGYYPSQDLLEGPVRPPTGLLGPIQGQGSPPTQDCTPKEGTQPSYKGYLDGSFEEDDCHFPDVVAMLEHMRSI